MSGPASLLTERLSRLSKRSRALILIALLIPVFLLYIRGIDSNPPGFYIDEAAVSYNAYTIARSGEGEFGHKLPLYFPVFPLPAPLNYLGYVEPVQIYALAALNIIFTPSVTLSRGLSAASIFLAALLIGALGRRISGSLLIGAMVFLSALATPWLYEMSRLAFSASMYPLMAALLLYVLYRASRKEAWSIPDILCIGLSLALTTYTYSIGRLLGPLLALGLVLFISNLKQIKGVLLAWVAYAITLVPMLIFHLQNPDALTGRLSFSVGYISAEKSYGQIFVEFIGHYLANISPNRLLFIGDLNERHHIPETAPILIVTLVLAFIGVAAILLKYRSDLWMRFVIYGLIVSVVPASFTKDDFHMLRLAAFPVFLLALTLPALGWIFNRERSANGGIGPMRLAVLGIVIAGTAFQAVSFQWKYHQVGADRLGYFDAKFPGVFAAALERPERPIYLVDQNYYHAYWQAISQGVDLANFVRLPPMKRPPVDALVLSGEERCSDCEMLVKDIPYVLYKTRAGPPANTFGAPLAGTILRPRGISALNDGGYVVADTGNARILKFDRSGVFLSAFGTQGEREGELKEPHGVTVDASGSIYVTDSGNHKLLRFRADGSFDREWRGPDGGFYGPRDLAVGSAGQVYIVDQGRNRIVRYQPKDDSFDRFGVSGQGGGQLNDPTGIAVSGESVYVADTGNRRIQIFDSGGQFIKAIIVPQWKAGEVSYPDLIVDDVTKRIIVTDPGRSELLAFSIEGDFIESVRPDPRYSLRNPSGLAILSAANARRLLVLNTGSGPLDQDNFLAIFDLALLRSAGN